jgi:hypothetical protein
MLVCVVVVQFWGPPPISQKAKKNVLPFFKTEEDQSGIVLLYVLHG